MNIIYIYIYILEYIKYIKIKQNMKKSMKKSLIKSRSNKYKIKYAIRNKKNTHKVLGGLSFSKKNINNDTQIGYHNKLLGMRTKTLYATANIDKAQSIQFDKLLKAPQIIKLGSDKFANDKEYKITIKLSRIQNTQAVKQSGSTEQSDSTKESVEKIIGTLTCKKINDKIIIENYTNNPKELKAYLQELKAEKSKNKKFFIIKFEISSDGQIIDTRYLKTEFSTSHGREALELSMHILGLLVQLLR